MRACSCDSDDEGDARQRLCGGWAVWVLSVGGKNADTGDESRW